MTYNKADQAVEKKNRILNQHRKTAKALGAKLVPLDLGADLGIRRQDCYAFKAAAHSFHSIILVRETNRASLPYIKKGGYTPKPIDCKIKTADANAYVPGAGRQSLAAGLVVDPGLLGAQVYSKASKLTKAREEWSKFLSDKTPAEIENKVFWRRGGGKGFYAVDTYPQSDRYGCLMLSAEQDIPVQGFAHFNLSLEECQRWKREHMKYIHGDYDLYALVDPDSPNAPPVRGTILNEVNYHSNAWPLIKSFVDDWIGAPMIQHGEQFHLFHMEDTLYVFYPHGGMYSLVSASAQSIADICEVLFHVNA